MASRFVSVGLALGLAAVAGLALPASGAVQIKPRPGNYAGQEADGTTPMPVTFTVTKNRKRVIRFKAQAIAKAGCTNQLQSVQAPFNAPIVNGHFTKTSTTYPQHGIRVTVTGTFLSPVKARGHITIHYARVKGCNASRLFTAHRNVPTAAT